jgi:predicted metal-dependent hydrolase
MTASNPSTENLEGLLTKAIAHPSIENIQALKNFRKSQLDQVSESFTTPPNPVGSFSRDHLSFLNGHVELKDLIKAREDFLRQKEPSLVAAQVDSLAKQSFCSLVSTSLRSLTGLPPEVSMKAYQILARYQIDNNQTVRQTTKELLKSFEDVEFCVQGWNVLDFFKELFKILEKEEEEEEDVFVDAVEEMEPASPTIQELQNQIQNQKKELITNTQLYLTFKLAYELCLPPKDHAFYLEWLTNAQNPSNRDPTESAADYLKNIFVQSASAAGFFSFDGVKARLIWWFASFTTPSLVEKLFNHHFDAFYKNYVEWSSAKDGNIPPLFDHIIRCLDRYLSVLIGAYERVADMKKKNDGLAGLMAQELKDPCNYGDMTRDQLYEKFLRHEFKIILGNSRLAQITSFVLAKLVSWAFMPKIMRWVDKSIESLVTSSSGYPHGINLILKQQLLNLKRAAEQPLSYKQTISAPLPLTEQMRLRGSIELILTTLSWNMANSTASLKAPKDMERMLYSQAAKSGTAIASQLMHDLSTNDQMEKLFLQLMKDAGSIYKQKPAFQGAEDTTDADVRKLSKEVFELYVKRFTDNLDLSGRNEIDLFKQLMKDMKSRLESFTSQHTNLNERLQFDESRILTLQDQIQVMRQSVADINKPLQDLSAYSLKSNHLKTLKTLDGNISGLQRELMGSLNNIEDIMSQMTKKKELNTICGMLEQFNTSLANPPSWLDLRAQLEKYTLAIAPNTWAELERTYSEFAKNREEKEKLEVILSDLAQNKDQALDFLQQQSSWMRSPIQSRWLNQVRTILAATPATANIPEEASMLETTWRKISFKAPSITKELQGSLLEDVRKQLQRQLDQRNVMMESAKTPIKALITEAQRVIQEKLNTLMQDPKQHFARPKEELQRSVLGLARLHVEIPHVYNAEPFSNQKVYDIVVALLELPGFRERYLESTGLLLGRTEIWSGLAAHLVLLPMVQTPS